MAYRKFYISLIIRVLLLLATLIGLAWIILHLSEAHFTFTFGVVVLLIVVQVWEMVRWLSRYNRVLIRFIESISHGDYTLSFSEKSSDPFYRDLISGMNEFISKQAKRDVRFGSMIGFLEQLIHQLPNGIICWDDKEKTVFHNPSVLHLLNWENPPAWKVFVELFPALIMQDTGDGVPATMLHVQSTHGQELVLKISLKTVVLMQKQIRVVTVEDISSEIQKRETEAWQKLLRLLSHEIRNSITPVASLSETISMILRNPDGKAPAVTDFTEENLQDILRSVEIIRERSVRLNEFTENVLKVTRIPTPDKELVQINDVLDKMAELFSSELAKSHILLKIEGDSRQHQMNIDPIQFDLILSNMLSNSIHALDKAKERKISVLYKRVGTYDQIIIKDTGIGIPVENRDKIFMPFFTTRQDGHGLGLSIARQMIEMHGGQIQCESEPGEWTRFVISIPSR